MSDPDPDARPDAQSAAPDPGQTADRDDQRDDEYALDPDLVAALVEAIEADDRVAALAMLEDFHNADIADLLEQITSAERRQFIELLGAEIDPEVLIELEEGVRDDVLGVMDPKLIARAARELDSDDVVYLVEDLADDTKAALLEALDPADRAAVALSLAYPEYSAGRLMQRELVKAPPFWTVGQMIDYMRASDHLPDEFYDVIVVDPAARPVGTIPLSRIMGASRPVTLGSLMEEDFRTLHVEESQEDVAYAFKQYHLVSCPVVDDDGRLVGVITIDDAVTVLDEEAEEDILRLGGVGDEEISDRVWEITRRRFPWLAANLVTAILASGVIALFDATIAEIVALAVLMPIVASMGGNAATQTMTVAVRALATRDLTRTNAFRIVTRETAVGLANGVAFAILIGLAASLFYSDWLLGAVLAAAMVVNMLVAGVAGILIPLGIDKAGADPALASGVFVTTVTDVVGFFAFLGLAAAVLI